MSVLSIEAKVLLMIISSFFYIQFVCKRKGMYVPVEEVVYIFLWYITNLLLEPCR